jgi:hypothetical protein
LATKTLMQPESDAMTRARAALAKNTSNVMVELPDTSRMHDLSPDVERCYVG